MSERKIIQFNPELFKIPEKKPRQRNKNMGETAKILPKAKIIPKQNRTLKNSVLRMIRSKQQEETYKQKFQKEDSPKNIPVSSSAKNEHVKTFENDFEESLKFATNFVEQHNPSANKTLKQYPQLMQNNDVMVNTVLPADVFNNVYSQLPMPTIKSSIILNKPVGQHGGNQVIQTRPQMLNPKWGCLKGGKLMTYRTFHNKTAKNYGRNDSLQTPMSQSSSPPPFIPPSHPPTEELKMNLEKIKHFSEKEKKNQKMPKLKYKKQKKTLKRTYVVGRSKYFPKIGILISNKTIRNKTTEKIQLLKQTPMTEIRKFLIKRGFIKIGTPAPNDLLRKMYESVNLVCGEIQNHNSDNLLFNFFNDH